MVIAIKLYSLSGFSALSAYIYKFYILIFKIYILLLLKLTLLKNIFVILLIINDIEYIYIYKSFFIYYHI